MRRWIAVWTLLGSLALAGAAEAGTYDVVSCGAGGARVPAPSTIRAHRTSLSGRPGTYPIRVRIRRQSRFAFAPGYSRAVRVGVR